MKITRNLSHSPTWIAQLSATLEGWRRTESWSRETLCQEIVEAHVRTGQEAVTGIVFDSPTRDPFLRQKNNADRIYRWLDDVRKDSNLLPANFIPSLLAALPEPHRIALLDDLLAPFGLEVALREDVAPEGEITPQVVGQHLRSLVEHSAEATVAVSAMQDGIDPGEPEAAHKKLRLAGAAFHRTLGLVGRLLQRKGKKQ